MASRLNPTNFGYQNFYSATLTADITAGALTISLDTVPTPTSGILVIDPNGSSREVILYTSKGASTITCPSDGRGYSGSTAASHLSGTSVIMAPVDKFFTALASGELSTDPLRTEQFFDFVSSGLVWSGDSYASTRNASMTSGVVYIGGRRLTVAAVTSRSFTASKDTYVDLSDNGDGTALITYTEVANNAASPALAANSIRVAIIVTGASNIAAAGSINQGQESAVLPIASSVAYTVTDSLGNRICSRDPNSKLLGYRQLSANFITSSSGDVAITGLSVPVIIPTGRKIKITTSFYGIQTAAGAPHLGTVSIWDGTVGSGSKVDSKALYIALNTGDVPITPNSVVLTPSSTSKTYNVGINIGSTNQKTISFSSALPSYVMVELV